MDDIGGTLVPKLKKLEQEGKQLRIVFDNFDFKILANILL